MLKIANIKLGGVGVSSLFGVLLAAFLYLAVNILLNVVAPTVRLDVTEESLYTLSRGTHATLAKIDEPVKFHFFSSERLAREVPFYALYGRRIRELLVEIESASAGKVVLREHNPEPFSDEEEMAVKFGIQGVPIDQGGELVYFGLAGVNSADDVELIPFFRLERENLLEYDLVRMIHALSDAEPTVVGVMSSLPIMGDRSAQTEGGGVLLPWAIANRLNKNFNTVSLPESTEALPENIDVMMVVHPRALSERAVYELEQFLFRGGRAMLFIDPNAESDSFFGAEEVSTSTGGLQLLFEKWGIEVPDGRLVADQSMAMRVNVNTGAGTQTSLADYLIWLKASGNNIAQNDPVTNRLPALNFASSGFIVGGEDSPLTMEPLIFSGIHSSPVSVEDAGGVQPDIFGLLDRFKADDNIYVMAARLTGDVTTAFPDGPPPRTSEETEQELAQEPAAAQLMNSDGPIHLIVVADSDLLQDRFWLRKQRFFGRDIEQPIAGNADFVLNALDNLSGSDGLLTLRTRGVSQRPFEKVNELRQDAQRRLQERERDLKDNLQQTQTKVAELEGVRSIKDSTTGETTMEVTLTEEQHAELEALRSDMLTIRKQLRAVQRGLREDVERLESWLRFINIGLIPLLISGIAIVLGVARIVHNRRNYARARERTVA